MGDLIRFPQERCRWPEFDPAQYPPATIIIGPFVPRELQAREQEMIVDLRKIEALFSREAYNAFGGPPTGWLDHPNCRCTIEPLVGGLDEIINALNFLAE